ncbi:ATP-binding protein [Streptomyces sp. NPDC001292]|uniref:ATP-binding protein n=1 Tax=Streptomyces sp. NPDC001292 TaxID=3364558 RepID=UPI0036CE4993
MRAQQMGVAVECLDLAVLRRHPVMAAHRHRELPGLLDRPAVPLLQPLPQLELDGEGGRAGAAAEERRDGQVPPPRVPLPGDPEDAAIDEACRDLRLPAFRERFVELAATARREQLTYKQFLLDLLQKERADRDVRRQQRLIRSAKFPRPKRIEDFRFDKNPNVPVEVVADLKATGWVREGPPAGDDR